MRRNLFIKIIAILLVMLIGSASLCFAAPSAFNSDYGQKTINSIKDRNNESTETSNKVDSLKNRAKNKNITSPSIKRKESISNEVLIASDARFFEIYDSIDDNKKVIGSLKAYSKVSVIKTVGEFYQIKEGFINKKALLTEQEFGRYSKRRGELNSNILEKSNASIDDIKKMTNKYPNAKGLELTFLLCEEEYNINATFMISCAILESQMGESRIGRKKNNWFGIQAYDWDPFKCAKKFDNPAECIDYWCNLINDKYVSEGRTTLDSIGIKYCSSSSWASSLKSIINRLINLVNSD